jgi:hypothetical protein
MGQINGKSTGVVVIQDQMAPPPLYARTMFRLKGEGLYTKTTKASTTKYLYQVQGAKGSQGAPS